MTDGYLGRDDFFNRARPRFTSLRIPQLGGDVRIKSLSALERGQLDELYERKAGREQLRQQVVLWACVDADGQPLFQPEDLQRLDELDGTVVDVIYRHVIDFNAAAAEELETIKKN